MEKSIMHFLKVCYCIFIVDRGCGSHRFCQAGGRPRQKMRGTAELDCRQAALVGQSRRSAGLSVENLQECYLRLKVMVSRDSALLAFSLKTQQKKQVCR